MRSNYLKIVKTAFLAAAGLLLGVTSVSGQQQINLTAAPTTTTTSDGNVVPMWGYSCGAVDPNSSASCARLRPGTDWSPVLITVPTGQSLQINLNNKLTFANGNTAPTSLTIVGQLGGGLGDPGQRTTTPSPAHGAQGITWPVVDTTTTNTPPPQGARVQSFSTEVAANATTSLTWNALRPGTYLLESGTHPSIQGPMGLYGIVVVTCAPGATACANASEAYPGVAYAAEIPLLLSEIDPVQNNAVSTAANTVGFSETAVWSAQTGACGDPAVHTCYPPAVNYSPRYYLINGTAFSVANVAASVFHPSPSVTSGNILVRFVNAGLRMHVPSIVGATTGASLPGFGLIAEDGNPLPGVTRVQNEVFLAAGKTYDVMINAGTAALPVYDRALGLSANATARDAGMLAYIGPTGAAAPVSSTAVTPVPHSYYCVAGTNLIVSDPSQGVLAGTGANGAILKGVGDPTIHTLLHFGDGASTDSITLNPDGTFTYVQDSANTKCGGTFTFALNGTTTASATITQCEHGTSCTALGGAPIAVADSYASALSPSATNPNVRLQIPSPGVLANDADPDGHPLTAVAVGSCTGGIGAVLAPADVTLSKDGSFSANISGAGNHYFCYNAINSQKTASNAVAVNLSFPAPSNLKVTVTGGLDKATITDYRWIIEEDRTFYVDPNCQTNPLPASCPTVTPSGAPFNFGTNFHTSYMPVVAQGCTGTISCENGQTLLGQPAVCDLGDGICRTDAGTKTPTDPSQVVLDPNKRYYISVLPGDAVDPGHAMGGAQIAAHQTVVNVTVQPLPLQPAKVSVFVFQDDHPLNGEHDASGGIDTLSPNEPGLGGFNITIMDLVGQSGDSAGQMTYDEFGQPLSNALAGTKDPNNGNDACPVSKGSRTGVYTGDQDPPPADGTISPTGITGVIPVCPKYESDGKTLSPLAGQAVVANLPPGRYGVVATPGADRIARGEEWLQTNTLDGGKDLEAFLKAGEPSYFQEFGPAGYHVSMGFANPQWINDAGVALRNSLSGQTFHKVTGKVTGARMSRPSDERLYSSGTRDIYGYTQCYVSLGSPDGADFAFTKCNNDDGTFVLDGIPEGDWRITIFDQWNDQIVDGITTPVRVTTAGNSAGATTDMGEVAVHGWKNNLYTRTFIDIDANGVSDPSEPGLSLVPTNVRYRDGSISNLNSTDLDGYAGFNEVFPIFNWYVMETDSTRYKTTGIHVINDAGGPVDGSSSCGGGLPECGNSVTAANMARTKEDYSLPTYLRLPGSVYCDNADCNGSSIASLPNLGGTGGSTGRIDAPWAQSYGWQSYMGQNQFLEFGKKPYAPGENGGIHGHVVYASTRPFDDPALLLQLTWEPMVPHVKINLYQEGKAADGSPSLKLVDHTETSSWDDWAQGFRPSIDSSHSGLVPNISCPGQAPQGSPIGAAFMYTIMDQPQFLDVYQNGTGFTPLPEHSQFKCFDGMHIWNQLQPAPYDGMYQFPSVTSIDPVSGKPTGTNCTSCVPNPDLTDPYRAGTPMLPSGKYVVEMILPPGYELVKEEDKNILLGDTYEAPVTQQFPGFGNIFILPDQASILASYNPNNPYIPSTDLGVTPRHEGDTGSVETFWPCVGAERIVPDFMSLFPNSGQHAPFAGASRRLCDRKEVIVEDQMSALAKFYVFTSTHIAAHFTGIISDDFTSEFDPFSPNFGEKFSPANLPVGVRDWTGAEISRVYSDQWGIYNGLVYSTFSVNPPDPSGYIPNMMVMCMNDRGSAGTADPMYQASYSQFCYEWSFMPGQTSYMDTPVIPTTAFAEGYNHPDCAYPDFTPAIKEVDGDGVGPWVSAANRTLTIAALGDQDVNNYGYSGPRAKAVPFNQKTVTRHYNFGNRCTTIAGACTAVSSVTIGGQPATITGWSPTSITVTVPSNVPACAIQQQQQYGGPNNNSPARCGELVVKAGNGKTSIDSVTVTIGGKSPKHIAASDSIQAAIDAAAPGDLLIVDPTCNTASATVACTTAGATKSGAVHHELVVMWKPVRLQGVGAASTIIDANAHPSGILNDWRLRMVCLFGLAPNGVPAGYNKSCGSGWNYFNPTTANPQVDRLPLEATVGWDATLNGNLAEQLQEPTLLGAYEGAGITVVAKGVRFPNGSNPFAADTFPTGTTMLLGPANFNPLSIAKGDASTRCRPSNANPTNPFPSNFQCNPSSIDGLSVTNSSQGGGGIFIHGWAHNLEVANDRVYNNQGTLAGGITVGQGEHPDAYLAGSGAVPDPGSCRTEASLSTNAQLPYCFNVNVAVHNNYISNNASEGDELFSATPSGAGGAAFCTGDDYYKFNYNWVCGNMSTGDGAGMSQMGFVWHNTSDTTRGIQHNVVLFNQSTNPTTPSNGGGLMIMSAPDTDPICPGEPDVDCGHAFGSVGDGLGPGLLINANLVLGNAAEAGAGGGIRFQGVNGAEVSYFPTRNTQTDWYSVDVTNNIIANNVAGWDGAGVSLQDSLAVNLVNNTIVSNDSTASSGTLFGAFFATQASAPTPCPPDFINQSGGSGLCVPLSLPQPAGVSSAGHSAEFLASLPATINCPPGHGSGGTGTGGRTNGDCRVVSQPVLRNDVIWHNRAFNIVVADPKAGELQATVTLVPQLNQTSTGVCIAPTDPKHYWDIGFRADSNQSSNNWGPNSHDSGHRMTPTFSVLSDISGYGGANNTSASPALVSLYCNGSRIPPENTDASGWYNVPPGTNETNVPTPVFNLTAGATVDESNNWVNINWGPLSLENPVSHTTLANFNLGSGSSALDAASSDSPLDDFNGTARPLGCSPDIGAIEMPAASGVCVTPKSLAFGNVRIGTTSSSQTITIRNTQTTTATGISFTVPAQFVRPLLTGGSCPLTATFSLTAGNSCTINIQFRPTAPGGAVNAQMTFTRTGGVVIGSPVTLSGNGVQFSFALNAPSGVTLATILGIPTLNFGSRTTGSQTDAVLTVTNTSASSFTFGANTVSNLTGQTFTIQADSCSNATVASNGSCSITVRFRPTNNNLRVGTVTLVDSTGATMQTIALSGS